MIKFRNVTKTYNKTVKALDDVSFDVSGGEIVGFIGPNGSGKTTTMKLLTGIIKADKGKISVNGFDIREDPIKAKQSIGYIADSPDMFLRLKGTEFLELIGDIYKVSEKDRRERISSLSEKFGLTEALSSPMMSYSHGMRQKMMVIAALLHKPPVWILDEPMIGLDPKSAFELKQLMRDHTKEGNAVFFSTHVLEVAEKLYKNDSLENIFLELTEK